MIYFNSDYLEGAHPALLEKLNETNMVQTVGYGEDLLRHKIRKTGRLSLSVEEVSGFHSHL